MDNSNIVVVSYNGKGFSVSKVPCISKILKDVLLLQETWLFSKQFNLFSIYFPTYKAVSVCGMDESEMLKGRPYGGVTILNRNKIKFVLTLSCNFKRICGIQCLFNNTELFIYNIYMPCDYQSLDNYLDFNQVLSDLSFSFAKYNV